MRDKRSNRQGLSAEAAIEAPWCPTSRKMLEQRQAAIEAGRARFAEMRAARSATASSGEATEDTLSLLHRSQSTTKLCSSHSTCSASVSVQTTDAAAPEEPTAEYGVVSAAAHEHVVREAKTTLLRQAHETLTARAELALQAEELEAARRAVEETRAEGESKLRELQAKRIRVACVESELKRSRAEAEALAAAKRRLEEALAGQAATESGNGSGSEAGGGGGGGGTVRQIGAGAAEFAALWAAQSRAEAAEAGLTAAQEAEARAREEAAAAREERDLALDAAARLGGEAARLGGEVEALEASRRLEVVEWPRREGSTASLL